MIDRDPYGEIRRILAEIGQQLDEQIKRDKIAVRRLKLLVFAAVILLVFLIILDALK